MTEKELRRLNRTELMELLLEVSREKEKIQEELDEAREKLSSRELNVSECGSIAEAALKVNRIFEDAQEAADQYLENIRRPQVDMQAKCEEMEKEARRYCAKLVRTAEKKAATIEQEAEEKADAIIEEARNEALVLTEETKEKCDAILNRVMLQSQNTNTPGIAGYEAETGAETEAGEEAETGAEAEGGEA